MTITNKRRIFIALNISDELKEKIKKWQETFKQKFQTTYNYIRWVPRENLHITLIPPFEIISEVQLKKIDSIIDDVSLNNSKFDVTFTDISYGPYWFNPRLIWISGITPKEILDLKNVLLNDLLKLNLVWRSDFKKDYLLHLTIARFNQFDYKYFNAKTIKERFEHKETIKEIILFESFLKKEKAEYKILKKVNLKL